MRFVWATCLMVVACVVADQTPVVLCGRRLAVARELLCYGADYTKRSMGPSVISDYIEEKPFEVDIPWNGRHGALSASWSRLKREGLADDCCLKPCTTDVILSYC